MPHLLWSACQAGWYLHHLWLCCRCPEIYGASYMRQAARGLIAALGTTLAGVEAKHAAGGRNGGRVLAYLAAQVLIRKREMRIWVLRLARMYSILISQPQMAITEMIQMTSRIILPLLSISRTVDRTKSRT